MGRNPQENFSNDIFRRIPKFWNDKNQSKTIFWQKNLKMIIFIGSSRRAESMRLFSSVNEILSQTPMRFLWDQMRFSHVDVRFSLPKMRNLCTTERQVTHHSGAHMGEEWANVPPMWMPQRTWWKGSIVLNLTFEALKWCHCHMALAGGGGGGGGVVACLETPSHGPLLPLCHHNSCGICAAW